MSILLEALRKSEKNKDRQTVPTIHSDNASGLVANPFNFWPLALMISAVLVVSGWVTLRQYQVPKGFYQPPVTLPAGRNTPVAEKVDDPATGAETIPEPPPQNRAADDPGSKQRTPVESYKVPPSSTQEPVLATAGESSEKVASNQVSAKATKQTDTKSAAKKQQPPTKPVQQRPHRPEPISYWELPDAVRAQIPEIKFSVLVYATDPKDRFVLINGQRITEGGSLQAGLVVKEIRRDGVLFSYRLYRFLVER